MQAAPITFYEQRHYGAAHDAVVTPGRDGQLLTQAAVEPVQALANAFESFVEVVLHRQFRQAGDDQLAGDVAP
jgi:hypothetical protein